MKLNEEYQILMGWIWSANLFLMLRPNFLFESKALNCDFQNNLQF